MYRKKLDIVLFNSPIYRYPHNDNDEYLPPLGQGYIITMLKKQGISADLIDCVYERLGVSDIIDIINQGSFSNVGFNVFSVNVLLIKDIVLGIKRNVHIYFGGKALEHLWKEILKWDLQYPTTFIIGEGELIFPDLMLNQCKESPIFDNGKCKTYLVNKMSQYYPSNLNLTFLDRSLFKNREILNRYNRYEACLVASRGCIYNCAFCGGAKSANPNSTVRIRSIESLSYEIKDIINQNPNVKSIRVLDDLFLRNRNSITDACRLFSSFPNLHWRCMAHINTFIYNLDLISSMRDSGCDEVFIGIESGSLEVRQRIHKLGTPQNVICVIKALMANGINVKGYFMCGFPNETKQQLQETLSLAETLHTISNTLPGSFRSVAFYFRPYHGTELFNELRNRNLEFDYRQNAELVHTKQQYNFSAGNFSNVSNELLEYYVSLIDHLNK